MPPFAPTALASALHEDCHASLLDLVQQRLSTVLGHRYTVILTASGDDASHYHLAIQHSQSGLSLEDNGSIGPGFAERLLALGGQVKAMLESQTFARMGSDDPTRPLVWLSDMADSARD
jgi:glucose-6-phosphate-specific signal transduction histidine kinase